MRVIGAGFGRTGTSSLKVALETLGLGPCYHMSEVFYQAEHRQVWVAAARGERQPDWRNFLGGYQATVDWPGCLFWRELADAFGDAKVLLNTRDPERWHESLMGSIIYGHPDHPDHQRLVESVPEAAGLGATWGAVADRQFGGFDRLSDREQAIEVFRRHYAEVRDAIPADRLLEYEVKQGWEPLCAFLDVPVPDEPFPRLNDRAGFQQGVRDRLNDSAQPG